VPSSPGSKEHQAVKVDIQPDVHDIAARLGAGATYALKALAGRLADDPDMGRPSGLPGILSVRVDGDMFEDCPDLDFGYIREPDRVEIRFLMAVSSEDASSDGEEADEDPYDEQARPADPAADAVAVRQVADAWQRITGWLRRNAPDSYAALHLPRRGGRHAGSPGPRHPGHARPDRWDAGVAQRPRPRRGRPRGGPVAAPAPDRLTPPSFRPLRQGSFTPPPSRLLDDLEVEVAVAPVASVVSGADVDLLRGGADDVHVVQQSPGAARDGRGDGGCRGEGPS
jgi:hypothetical protein